MELAKALGEVFTQHGTVDWERWFGRQWHTVQLPGYVWDEENYSRDGQPAAADLATTHTREYQQDAAGLGVRPHGLALVPLSLALALVLDTAEAVHGSRDYVIEEGSAGQGLAEIADGTSAVLQVVLTGTAEHGTASVWLKNPSEAAVLCLRAGIRAVPPRTDAVDHTVDLDEALGRCAEFLGQEAFLRMSVDKGYRIAPGFHSVRQLWRREAEAIARLRMPTGLTAAAAWEACFEPLLAVLPAGGANSGIWLPTSVGQARFLSELPEEVWVTAVFEGGRSGSDGRADVRVTNSSGEILASFLGIELRAPSFRRGRASRGRRLLLAIGTAGSAVQQFAVSGTRGRAPAPRRTVPRANGVRGNGLPLLRASVARRPEPVLQVPDSVPAAQPATPVRDTSTLSESEALLDYLAEILCLPVDRLDRHRAPRDHGLDSLMAQQVSRRLRASHSIDMSPTSLLGEGSLASLMDRLLVKESVGV